MCVCVCVYIYIYVYIYIQFNRTPLDQAVENKNDEVAAVLRAHDALHSLLFAADKGMMDEVAAGMAAGLDVNARDEVIYLCVRAFVCVLALIYVYICISFSIKVLNVCVCACVCIAPADERHMKKSSERLISYVCTRTFVCMYVCIYALICISAQDVCIHTHARTHTHIYVYTYIRTSAHRCTWRHEKATTRSWRRSWRPKRTFARKIR
jgi:hypothetical protein